MTAQISAYGRIAAEVQKRETSTGGVMAFTRLAVSVPCRGAESTEGTMWLDITAFGKTAEALALHQKGDLISVFGGMQLNQWTDSEGKIRSDYQMKAEGIISASTVQSVGKESRKQRDPRKPRAPRTRKADAPAAPLPARNDYAQPQTDDDTPPF